jgi:hypothetical protein
MVIFRFNRELQFIVLFVLTSRIKCGTGAKNQKSQDWRKLPEIILASLQENELTPTPSGVGVQTSFLAALRSDNFLTAISAGRCVLL